MYSVQYRPTQRRTWWSLAAVAAIWALASVGAALWSSWFTTSFGRFFIVGGLLGAFGVPLLINLAMGRTFIDSAGIRTWRPTHRCVVAWHEITEIDVQRTGVRHSDYWIRVHRNNGTPVRLPAPMNSDAGQDPETATLTRGHVQTALDDDSAN